jgi:Sulfotransferase family
MSRMPDLFIVGAPKCGTTSLYEWLKDHPEIHMSPFKEPCYFARDLALETSGYYFRYGEDRERYLALFSEAGPAKRLGEASTRYLYSKDAPGLIAAEASDPRIVVMLRNPVDMIASLHAHKLGSGTEDLADLGDALAAEDERREGRRLPGNSNPLLSTYTDRAMFGEQLARWFDVFGRERVRVMIFEDVVRSPEAHFASLLEFLDVDPAYRPATFAAHNPAHGSRGKIAGAIARSRPVQFAMWRLVPLVIGDVRTLELTRRLAQGRLVRRPIAGKAEVPVELRRRLEAKLTPDVERLSGLLHYDLVSRWFRAGTSTPAAFEMSTD